MYMQKWQRLNQHYLSEFSTEELKALPVRDSIPKDLSSIPCVTLSEDAIEELQSSYEDLVIWKKLPNSLNKFYVRSDIPGKKLLIFFERLENHPNWFITDIFADDRYMCTFLGLDVEPSKEFFNTDIEQFTPICHALTQRPSLSSREAYEQYKYAYYLLLHASAFVIE